tara:strand:- start:3178 stop:4176 length:999 start_codon:yes stop_codon:yes gene_type:complete
MRKLINKYSFIVLVLALASFVEVKAQTSYGTDRAGTESFQFTKITVDARSAAMGNSNMADATDGSSLYWNPALASKIGSSYATLSHTDYLVDTGLEYFSYIHKLGDFAVGGSVQYFNSGDINETTESQPFGTGRTFRTNHLSVGLTGSHKITDLFSYGITLKYLTIGIEEVSYSTGAIDFGFSYLVGDTGLRFAVGINNFGLDASPNGETVRSTPNGDVTEEPDTDISLPTRFTISAAYTALDSENNSLILTSQITNPSDNAEQFSIGAEYGFMKQFFFRGGYEFGIEERMLPSLGTGVKVPFANRKIAVDYSFTNYDRLGSIHRITLGFEL